MVQHICTSKVARCGAEFRAENLQVFEREGNSVLKLANRAAGGGAGSLTPGSLDRFPLTKSLLFGSYATGRTPEAFQRAGDRSCGFVDFFWGGICRFRPVYEWPTAR